MPPAATSKSHLLLIITASISLNLGGCGEPVCSIVAWSRVAIRCAWMHYIGSLTLSERVNGNSGRVSTNFGNGQGGASVH